MVSAVSKAVSGGRESLARLLDGPAAELETRLGPPAEALARILEALGPGRLEAASGIRPFVVQLEVRAADGVHVEQVSFAPEGSTIELALGAGAGVARRPSLSYSLDLVDLLLMACGRLDPHQAFMGGRLRMSGDMAVAGVVEGWLTPPPPG